MRSELKSQTYKDLNQLCDIARSRGWKEAQIPSLDEQEPQYSKFKLKYFDNLQGFMDDCIDWKEGEHPTDYQYEMSFELLDKKRYCIRGPHGLGKTMLAAIAIIWFALTRDGLDWKCPTTASVWRQLSKFLWPEVHKWARQLKWDVIGREPFNNRTELLTLSLKLETGEAFALASDNPAAIEGAHADHILYIFDEAKTIIRETWDAAEGAMSGTGEAMAFAISTPGEASGVFYDIHKRVPGYEDWTVRHIRLDECVTAGRVSQDWADRRKRQWGEDSEVYQNRVLGEFSTSMAHGIIPLSWVEQANERWHEHNENDSWGDYLGCGSDIAEEGDDENIDAMRYEAGIKELRKYPNMRTMERAGTIVQILKVLGGFAHVDATGIGAGVYGRVKEQDADFKGEVWAYKGAEKTEWTDRSGELEFLNTRSAAYYNMRELLDPDGDIKIALPQSDNLTGDLTTPKLRITSAGKMGITTKEDVKKLLGRSPDEGDATVEAFWLPKQPKKLKKLSDILISFD